MPMPSAERQLPPAVKLDNTFMPYAWGSAHAVQRLMARPELPGPIAEVWMGAHGKAPSRLLLDAQSLPLDQAIRQTPNEILGGDLSELPFLFKVLAADRALSIQTHPSRELATAGYARERHLSPRDEARNYRDANTKPEILAALSPFWLVRGFRSRAAVLASCRAAGLDSTLPFVAPLAQGSDAGGLRTAFEQLLRADGEVVDSATSTLLTSTAPADDSDRWRWIHRLSLQFPGDRGVLAPLFMHLVYLRPGQAVFSPPGVLHAYLEGLGIELMGNSDNVLRGGLTSKHIDIDELMVAADFSSCEPRPIEPRESTAGVQIYDTPATSFRLSRIDLATAPVAVAADHGATLLLCTGGEGSLTAGDLQLTFSQGDSMLVTAAAGGYQLAGRATVFRAEGGTDSAAERMNELRA